MHESILKIIDIALAEDIGTGDLTSIAIVEDGRHSVGRISAKQSLVLAGMDVARHVFQSIDPDVNWDPKRHDGTRCEAGDILAVAEGNARALLAGERTALNFLQRLSGIATMTNLFAHAVRDMNVQILDTRKTTPGLRLLEKQAVRAGGGTNHRTGLYDHYLVKNNHIACAGSVAAAVAKAQQAKKPGQLVEVETRTLDEVKAALSGGVDIIMLDNMPVHMVHEAVKMVKGRTKVDVSGNITLENLLSYAATGVDYVSVGAITHSAPAVDIHMTIKCS